MAIDILFIKQIPRTYMHLLHFFRLHDLCNSLLHLSIGIRIYHAYYKIMDWTNSKKSELVFLQCALLLYTEMYYSIHKTDIQRIQIICWKPSPCKERHFHLSNMFKTERGVNKCWTNDRKLVAHCTWFINCLFYGGVFSVSYSVLENNA